MAIEFMPASDVRPGDVVVERDGAALEVVQIMEVSGRRIRFTMKTIMATVTETVKASARVRVMRPVEAEA